MRTSTETDARYPLEVIVTAIRQAMAGTDCTSTAEWTAPPECRCIREGKSCLQVQAEACLPGYGNDCRGYIVHVPVSSEKSLTPDHLIAALPEPDSAGMVSGDEVAAVLQAVMLDRLSWHPYWLASIGKRLGTAFGELEDTEAPGNRQPEVPVSVLKCAWCSRPIPVARGPLAKFCRNGCRVSSARARKRQREANEALRAGR